MTTPILSISNIFDEKLRSYYANRLPLSNFTALIINNDLTLALSKQSLSIKLLFINLEYGGDCCHALHLVVEYQALQHRTIAKIASTFARYI